MMLDFSAGDLARIITLISSSASDIVFKADHDGFILQASQGMEMLGGQAPGSLIPPRILDLVADSQRAAIEAELALAAGGNADRPWSEFPLAGGAAAGRWYALRLIPAGEGQERGQVLGILRDVHERRTLEDKLFAARMTDPLTGLTNRPAFDAMLQHVTANGQRGCLALFGIEHFRAINHRLGHSVGDEMLVGFAEVLRTVMRTGDTLSRIGDAQFAVLLPNETHAGADALCREARRVFTGQLQAGTVTLPLSATAGIAELSRCPHDTLRRAELAMVLGRASGSGPAEGSRPRQPRAAALPTRMADPARAPGFRRTG